MRFSFLGNPAKQGIKKYLSGWINWLHGNGHHVALSEDLANLVKLALHSEIRICHDRASLLQKCDLVISLGGDGTILLAAKYIKDSKIPILGVKFGGLGFLADVSPDAFQEAILEVQENRAIRQERLVLSGQIRQRNGQQLFALNEFVIVRNLGTQSSRIGLWVNETPVSSFIADGIIISSPTGSTAYSMAAGGPLVSPIIDVLIITPICPHSLTTRPIVVRDDACIWIEAQTTTDDELTVNADGEQVLSLQKRDMFEVKKTDYTITLLQRADHTFFDILKTKLHW
ncbi:MAG: NAD(+)/NADH kinase, partial [bacterium]